MNIRTITGLSLLIGVLAVAGCADNKARQGSAQGSVQSKDLLKAWKDASRHQAEDAKADAGKPEPEAKLAPMTHFSAAALYEKQGRYPQAVEQYRKAVGLNPSFAAAHGRLGLCYTKMGQFRLAVETLTKAAALQPNSATIWNNLGFAQLADGNAAAAEASLAKALAINPGYQRARINIALALVRQGRDDDALSHLQSTAPDYIALYNLGSMQLAASRAEPARTSLEKALNLRTDFPAAREALEQATGQIALTKASQPAGAAEPAQAVRSPSTRPSSAIAEAVAPVAAPAKAPVWGLLEASAPLGAGSIFAEGIKWRSPAPASVTTSAWSRIEAIAATKPTGFLAADLAPWESWSKPASVADMDLVSLQWFAWCDLVESLHVDVQSLPQDRLAGVMRKWLKALDQLEDQVRRSSPVIALAR